MRGRERLSLGEKRSFTQEAEEGSGAGYAGLVGARVGKGGQEKTETKQALESSVEEIRRESRGAVSKSGSVRTECTYLNFGRKF
jgi:hypothetical protein